MKNIPTRLALFASLLAFAITFAVPAVWADDPAPSNGGSSTPTIVQPVPDAPPSSNGSTGGTTNKKGKKKKKKGKKGKKNHNQGGSTTTPSTGSGTPPSL